jgi:phosphatidylglycerol lysyltransferase
MTALVGVSNFLSSLTPAIPRSIKDLGLFYPLEVHAGAHVFAAFSSFLLISLALNILRRKKFAWFLTCLLLLGSIASQLLRGVNNYIVAINLALLLLLLWMFPVFTAESDPPSIRQGIRVMVLAMVFTLAYGSLGFYLLDYHFSVNFDWGDAIRQTLAMFFAEDNAGLRPRTRFGAAFANSISTIGLLTTGYAFWMLLRPVFLRPGASPVQRSRAKAIVANHGCSSLAAFGLGDDKTLFFSPSGQSLIAFTTRGRGAVALGDPTGPEDDRLAVLEAFLAHCQRNDWLPAFYQVRPTGLDLYKSLGLRVLKVGEEGLVALREFSLEGKAAAKFRTPLNKMRKLGHSIEFHSPPISDDLLSELAPVSEEWLRKMDGSEKRFSMGWFNREALRSTELALVRTSDESISAFASLIVGVVAGEVMVDLMRSRNQIEPGTMDALFVSLFIHYKAAGFDRFSLGLSALSGLQCEGNSSRLERNLGRMARHLDRFYNFHGLRAFKSKFHPVWEPRYLIYPGRRALPDVLLALVKADSGDQLWDYLFQI